MKRERADHMNNDHTTHPQDREVRLLEAAANNLHDYGLAWRVLETKPALGQYRPDAALEIGDGDRKTTFLVEIKQHPRTAQAGAYVALIKQKRRPALLLADYINPELAEKLRHNEICFLDAVGNAYLRGNGLLVWVTGRKNTRRNEVEREARRAFGPTGLKVIFALLCRPALVEKDYRTIARVAGVALGTVQWVLGNLVKEGYVLREGRTKRRLIQLDRLLDAWALAYARDLAPRLKLGRYETRAFDGWREIALADHHAFWGGEAAAALITGYLKPETLTIWLDEPTPRLLAELGLRREEKGRVLFRVIFWTRELIAQVNEALAADLPAAKAEITVPPALIYAELLEIADARTLETASRIRNDWIDGPFRRYRARTAG